MATIKAIESRSVHQIQSGQVIVDLNSVVKELVENSLDAGATSIEVRFKNQGLESIEVQDNGKGIAPADFETVALKHYTSKLSSYEDLGSLETFGFRGEALSSLCALSNFHIVTARAEDGAVGKRLDFEISGKLKGTTVQAASRGTTVVVEKLFHNLPVRRRELEKNIKREYGKVLSLLNAYACISVGVRFSVSNQIPKGKKALAFSTKSNATTKENIANVFGVKTLLALVKLDLQLEMQPTTASTAQILHQSASLPTDQSKRVTIEGHISKPVFGEGRQTPDRQLFFVNSRPCALPQVTKAFNEVYKSFNVSQSPFIFANLLMDTNAYDVNVSPDKRTILLHDQAELLENLKAALTKLFEDTNQTVPLSQLPARRDPSYNLSLTRDPASPRLRKEESQPVVENENGTGDEEEGDRTDMSDVRAVKGNSKSSLMSNWVERNTRPRFETHTPKAKDSRAGPRPSSSQGSDDGGQSDDATATNRESAQPTTKSDFVSASEVLRRHQETDSRDLTTNWNVANAPVPDSLRNRVDGLESTTVDQDHADKGSESDLVTQSHNLSSPDTARSELKIPSIVLPFQNNTPGPVQNAFDRMRPRRTPYQTAEITIGDTTMTTMIGDPPSNKRRKIHEPTNPDAISNYTSTPLLVHGLRRFLERKSNAVPETSTIERRRNTEQDGDGSLSEASQDAASDSESGAHSEITKERHHVDHGDPAENADDNQSSDEEGLFVTADNDQGDADYVDEDEKKAQEDEKVARLIKEAEIAASGTTERNLRRASQLLKNGASRKDSTLQLVQTIYTSTASVCEHANSLASISKTRSTSEESMTRRRSMVQNIADETSAEAKLSLTVTKTDFERMKVIGQFNLGFVLAVRPASSESDEDELFIIDQHAADEKFNYERLQRTTTIQSQHFVRPLLLDLTAVEEEIVQNNSHALKANGFEITITEENSPGTSSSSSPSLHRPQYHLTTLPTSGEKTFDLSDLEELLHLLSESNPSSSSTTPSSNLHIPRPRKVQRMLAMRACRSSIMVGRTLTTNQMVRVVRHMGEMEKPWNCPHGRPTMRHLAGLGAWKGWKEGQIVGSEQGEGEKGVPMWLRSGGSGDGMRETDWGVWLKERRK